MIGDQTDDWKLDCFVEWVPKSHTENCPECSATGSHRSPRLGWVGDEDRTCNKCYGTGTITVGPRTPKPELPKHLLEHLRRAWFDYFNKEN
jgi:hypothetical protein